MEFKLVIVAMPGGAFQVIGSVQGMDEPFERGILAKDEMAAVKAARDLLLVWADMFEPDDGPQENQTTH